jgi:hypothetical protein
MNWNLLESQCVTVFFRPVAAVYEQVLSGGLNWAL